MTDDEERFLSYVRRGFFAVDVQSGRIWKLKRKGRNSSKWLPNSNGPTPCEIRMGSGGYYGIPFHVKGKKHHVLVHRIIYILGSNKDIPEGYVVNHINGIKNHNQFSNLECITVRDNTMHAREVLGVGPNIKKI